MTDLKTALKYYQVIGPGLPEEPNHIFYRDTAEAAWRVAAFKISFETNIDILEAKTLVADDPAYTLRTVKMEFE